MLLELFFLQIGTTIIFIGGILLAVKYGANIIAKALDRQGAKTLKIEGVIPISEKVNKNTRSYNVPKIDVKKLTRMALKYDPVETNIKTDATIFNEPHNQ